MTDPVAKRIKLDEEIDIKSINEFKINEFSNIMIKSVLPDDMIYNIPNKLVYIGKLQEKNVILNCITELSKLLPIPTLNHLKRVSNDEIIIYSLNDLISSINNKKIDLINYLKDESKIDEKDLEEFLKILKSRMFSLEDTNINLDKDIEILKHWLGFNKISQSTINILCFNIRIGFVPAIKPLLKWQYEESNKIWPCKFHPNKIYENLYENKFFDETEKKFHQKIYEILEYFYEKYNKQFAVAVDSKTKRIVAVGDSKIDENPIMHAPMVMIDNIAKSQNGGDWGVIDSTKYLNNFILNGIEELYQKDICEKFKGIEIGAQKPFNCSKIITNLDENADNLEKYGPYLCTGYDIYLNYEPCTMCAMGLIHSRARYVFYSRTSYNGALETLAKLHTVKDLNHHYYVFKFNKDNVTNN